MTMTLLEPVEMEDGNLWYPLYAGPIIEIAGEEEYSVIAYLNEDVVNHNVNVRYKGEEDYYFRYVGEYHFPIDGILYDFDEYEKSQQLNENDPVVKSTFMCEDGEHACGVFDWFNDKYAIVEGIGTVCLTDDVFNKNSADVLGVFCCKKTHLPCPENSPHLYEVTDGNGNVIYKNSEFQPGCTASIPCGEYKPMFEIGKVWKYNYIMPQYELAISMGINPEIQGEIRVDRTVKMDGGEYYEVNSYMDDSNEPLRRVGYFKEELHTHQVWIKASVDENYLYHLDYVWDGEYFNFINPKFGNVFRHQAYGSNVVDMPYAIDENRTFEIDGIEYEGFIFVHKLSGLRYAMVEGIGMVSLNKGLSSHECDLLGPTYHAVAPTPDFVLYPHLYEVTNADGTVIFRDPTWAPGCLKLNEVSDDSKVDITDGGISIIGSKAAEAYVYNAMGQLVGVYNLSNGSANISTTNYAAGLYILSVGGENHKFVVKK